MIWNRERHEKVWESPQSNPNHKKQKQWRFQGDHLPVETPEACWYWRRHCAIEVANIGVFNSPKCIIYTSYTLLHFVTVCSSMFVGEATVWLGTGVTGVSHWLLGFLKACGDVLKMRKPVYVCQGPCTLQRLVPKQSAGKCWKLCGFAMFCS